MTLQDKTALDATIAANLPDNSTGDITPTNHRAVHSNMADGIWSLVSTAIDDTDSPYTAVLDTQNVIYADATSGAITINLPAAASSIARYIRVKNVGTVNNVTLDADGAELIDDATTAVLTPLDTIFIHCDGTQWWILAEA